MFAHSLKLPNVCQQLFSVDRLSRARRQRRTRARSHATCETLELRSELEKLAAPLATALRVELVDVQGLESETDISNCCYRPVDCTAIRTESRSSFLGRVFLWTLGYWFHMASKNGQPCAS